MTVEQLNNSELNSSKLIINNNLIQILDRIKNDINIILDNSNFLIIIDFLRYNYNSSSKEDLIKYFGDIFEDSTFKLMLNSYVKLIIPNLLKDNTSSDFENISFLIFLLGGLDKEHPLNNFSDYNLDFLDNLCEYLLLDIEKSKNIDEFGINYYRFFYFIEILNKLCILNEIDESKYKIILEIVDLLKSKIYKIYEIDNKYQTNGGKNIIDNVLGKLKINFSHLELKLYSGNDNKIIFDIIKKSLIFQIEGFIKSKKSIYGNNLEKGDFIKQIFLGNMAHLMLDGIDRLLENISFEELKETQEFKDIIEKMTFSITQVDKKIKISKIETKKDLDILLNIFAYIYKEDEKIIGNKENKYKDCFDEFLKEERNLDNFKIESIYNIIKFDKNIELIELIKLGNKLIDKGLYNNYNFENIKVKILNNIIKRFDIYSKDIEQNIFLEKLLEYIEKNKIASQLLNSYSNIYLSVAIYYSYLFDEYSQEKAKEFYYNYNKISSIIVRHDNIFFKNIGKYIIKKNGLKEDGNCYKIGKINYSHYNEIKDLENRSIIDNKLTELLNNVFNDKKLLVDNSNLINNIGEILSKKIFNSIAKVKVIDKYNPENKKALNNGMEELKITIFNGYILSFLYPKIYKNKFKEIFNKEEKYIEINIKNLLSSYLKVKENNDEVQKSFIDKLTGLPNLAKLNKDLIDLNYNISFIGLKIASLKDINNGYGYKNGDIYLEKIIEQINKIEILKGKVFRIGGAQLGIIVHNKKNINEIINKIGKIEIKFNETKTKINFLYGVIIDTDENFLEKTNMAISAIKNHGIKISYYDELIHKSEKYKEFLDNGNELSRAIEENRLMAYYQDIVCAKTGKVYKKEALMRIKREDGNIMSPFKYLEASKKYGKLIDITYKMVSKVFKDAGNNPKMKFSINLSGDDLDNPDLLDFIENEALINFIDNNNITFEILEGGWDEGGDKFEMIKKIKDMGFKIAIDDLGAGSSGINRFNDLLDRDILNYAKIDGEIIKKLISRDPKKAKSAELDVKYIVNKAALELDKNGERKVKVIAEFIENEQIAKKCINLGVDYLQGYYYSKPEELK